MRLLKVRNSGEPHIRTTPRQSLVGFSPRPVILPHATKIELRGCISISRVCRLGFGKLSKLLIFLREGFRLQARYDQEGCEDRQAQKNNDVVRPHAGTDPLQVSRSARIQIVDAIVAHR